MKKFIISAAILAATSTAALAGGWTGGSAATPGALTFTIAPVTSVINATQTGVALPMNTVTQTTVGVGGNTSAGLTSGVNQTAGVMNVISSWQTSHIGY